LFGKIKKIDGTEAETTSMGCRALLKENTNLWHKQRN
jgi:hypothetical protein